MPKCRSRHRGEDVNYVGRPARWAPCPACGDCRWVGGFTGEGMEGGVYGCRMKLGEHDMQNPSGKDAWTKISDINHNVNKLLLFWLLTKSINIEAETITPTNYEKCSMQYLHFKYRFYQYPQGVTHTCSTRPLILSHHHLNPFLVSQNGGFWAQEHYKKHL